MVEVPVGSDSVLDKKTEMNQCDVALLLYDGHASTSFSYLQPIYQRIQSDFPSLPCFFVQTKSDLPTVTQESKVSPTTFFNKNKTLLHTTISTKTERPGKLFEELVAAAVLGQHGRKSGGAVTSWKRKVGLGVTITVVIGGLVLAGRFIWKA